MTFYNGPSASNPRWLPDGKSLVFEVREHSKRHIRQIAANGGPIRDLTGTDSDDVTPAPSADGRSVYFSSDRSGEWQVWKVSLAEGSLRRITRDGGYAPLESADGKFLYYTRLSGEGSICRQPLPEGPPEVIVSKVSTGWWEWANGGIYVARPAPGPRTGIVSYWDPRTRQERTVRTIAGLQIVGAPAFTVSPDGTWLLYPREDQGSSDIILVESFR